MDYAWYIKGLVDFERTPNILERLFRVDLTERPPTTARKSFAAFKTVVEQYPKSDYAHDARKRMIFLRNRLAEYEVHVAEYYLKRGAYVAAAQRAKGAIEQYDGAPAIRDALAILIEAYDRLDLKELAATGAIPSPTAIGASRNPQRQNCHHDLCTAACAWRTSSW